MPLTTEEHAEYACDACRARKVTCDRLISGCNRCASKGTSCTYSRSGIIRRQRKRKHKHVESDGASVTRSHKSPPKNDDSSHGPQPYLAPDIENTRDQLQGMENNGFHTLGALTTLSEACAEVWHHDATAFGKTGRDFFLFEGRMSEWVEVFATLVDRGQPLLFPPPPEVFDQLRACDPRSVQQGAWLVMFYSIVLSHISSVSPEDVSTKEKLCCNLWLALNDVRLLLEPSEANIQALVILASHVEEFTTPSLSWMLTSTACRMLQALGVNRRGLDEKTKERRRLVFWHLNLLDSGLAMIFGYSPTFHRAMSRGIPLPSMKQLLACQPHLRPTTETGPHGKVPSTFGAHFFFQVMTLSRHLADIWHVLHQEDDPTICQKADDDLEAWYRNAHQVLSAAAMTEKPFLDADACRSVDLGLYMLDFNHSYLAILLCRHSNQAERMRRYCISMLHLLPHLVSDSEEVFNGIVWQILCCPFTPFLALFGELLSHSKGVDQQPPLDTRAVLDALNQLPPFLKAMGERNSLARKLESVAVVLVKHATSIVEETTQPTPADSGFDSGSQFGDVLDWQSLLKLDSLPSDMLASWTADFFTADVNAVDWLG